VDTAGRPVGVGASPDARGHAASPAELAEPGQAGQAKQQRGRAGASQATGGQLNRGGIGRGRPRRKAREAEFAGEFMGSSSWPMGWVLARAVSHAGAIRELRLVTRR
jgi:hypothetical protein